MARTVLVAGRVFRLLTRRKNSLTVQPLGTEYPHSLIFRLPGTQKDAGWWLSEHRGEKRTALKKLDDYTFEVDRDRFKR